MAKKMLVDRVDDLETSVKTMLDATNDMLGLLNSKLPIYDKMVADRKLVLSRAKKMRMAKRQKRHEVSDQKGTAKNAG